MEPITKEPDVLIIGAGASGLMAALELALAGKSCAIIEGRDRAGGRIYTLNDTRFNLPVEAGAEFIHGKLKITLEILTKAKITSYATGGDVWRKQSGQWQKEDDFVKGYAALNKKLKHLKDDIPVAEFIETYLNSVEDKAIATSLKSYTEGYNAADTATASTFAMRTDLEESEEEQYRIEGGYQMLVQYLLSQVKKAGVSIHYSSPVTGITWQKNRVNITSGKQQWGAQKVLVTVPLGVLQKQAIDFNPSLPQITNAANALGFGNVVKIVLQFDEPFWENSVNTDGKNLKGFGFILSEEKIPTWWTQSPKKTAMLTGWLAGPNADKFKESSNHEILQEVFQSLAALFNMAPVLMEQKLIASHVANWAEDTYSRGGYSYSTVGEVSHKKTLKDGIENTVFFCGEALFEGVEIGTVEAALSSGREMAQKLIALS